MLCSTSTCCIIVMRLTGGQQKTMRACVESGARVVKLRLGFAFDSAEC